MIRLLTLLLAAVLFATPVMAAEPDTLQKIKSSNTITLGYREDARPFAYTGDDGKPAGYSVELCTRIAATIARQLGLTNLQTKWVKVTPENRLTSVINGTIDLECGSTTASLARQEQVDFSLMTFVDGGSLLVTDASGVRGIATLDGKKVGVVPGTTTEYGGTSPVNTSPVVRSTMRVEAPRNTPMLSTEPSRTTTPSATSERAPMKQLSSIITGPACSGSSTPPMPAPPEIWQFLPI